MDNDAWIAKLAITEYDGKAYPERYAYRQFKRLCTALGINLPSARERHAILIYEAGMSYTTAMVEALVELSPDKQVKICIRKPKFRRYLYDLGERMTVENWFERRYDRANDPTKEG